jgi:hypothetical protein
MVERQTLTARDIARKETKGRLWMLGEADCTCRADGLPGIRVIRAIRGFAAREVILPNLRKLTPKNVPVNR